MLPTNDRHFKTQTRFEPTQSSFGDIFPKSLVGGGGGGGGGGDGAAAATAAVVGC